MYKSPIRRARRVARPSARAMGSILAAYGLSADQLQQLARQIPAEVHAAMRAPAPPKEVVGLRTLLTDLVTPGPRERVRGPEDLAAMLMLRMGYLDHEQLVAVCLDDHSRIQDIALVYQGNLDAIPMRPVELFAPAVRHGSAAILLARNDPLGRAEPSQQDVRIAHSCATVGQMLDIRLIDYLLIGEGEWLSVTQWFKQRGAEQAGPGA